MAAKKGWKTWAAAIGGMFAGLGAVIAGIVHSPASPDMIWGGIAGFVGSLGLIGVGDKLQKMLDAMGK